MTGLRGEKGAQGLHTIGQVGESVLDVLEGVCVRRDASESLQHDDVLPNYSIYPPTRHTQ